MCEISHHTANVTLYQMTEEEKRQEAARIDEKALHIEASEIRSAERRGRAEGKAEKEAEIIAKMKAKGMTDEEIRNLIG